MPSLPTGSSSHPPSPPPLLLSAPNKPVVVLDDDDGAQLDTRSDYSTLPTFSQYMLPNSSLSDSSSAPNSPSAFAFSPITGDNDPSSPSSYDTDLTSLIGSWGPSPAFSSSSSPLNRDKGKGKQKAVSESISKQSAHSETTSNYDDKGKSVDRSYSLPSASYFEFDFEFEQDVNLAKDNVSPRTFSDIDDPRSHIANNPISLSPSYSSIPSSTYGNSYDIKPVPRHSISSLSLKSLRSSSSRSFDRIRRSFGRKDSRFKSSSPSPSPHSLSSSSRSSSTSSLQKKIRKVFSRKQSKRRNTFESSTSNDNDDGDDSEDDGEASASLDQSILSETTISPRAQTCEACEPLEDAFDSTKDSFAGDEVAGTVSEGMESLRLVSNSAPRALLFQLLPRELQLRILKDLVSSYEDSNAALIWTAKIAESTRWIGRERGMRELVRLATVSKSWHSLVFDGQLWESVTFSPHISLLDAGQRELVSSNPNKLPLAFLLSLVKQAGPFVRTLDLRGWSHLDNATFRAISAALLKSHETPGVDGEQVLPLTCVPPSSCDYCLSVTWNLQAETNLTQLKLRGCTGLTMQGVHFILLRSPLLRIVDLHGMKEDVVNDLTCEVLNSFCPVLERLDIGRCPGIRGTGLERLVRGSDVESARDARTRSLLKMLLASGTCGIDPDVMFALARFAPFLEVLDLSYSDVTDECIGAFVWWDEDWDEVDEVCRKIEVSSRYTASLSPSVRFTFTPTRIGTFFKRVTSLRHFNLSSTHVTDDACALLGYSVPQLECLELAGIGAALGEEGLVKLLETTSFIRRIDLEDASRVRDAVLKALTPTSELPTPTSPQPGHMLEHLILSYAHNISNSALLLLIRSCTRLTTLEVDNTRVWCAVVRTFVEKVRQRGIEGAKIAFMDCRTCSESFVTELLDAGIIKPRLGFRAFEARAIGGFLDGRDREDCASPSSESSSSPVRREIDECDDTRVALKSFWSWQALDAAKEAERKRNGNGNQGGRLSRSSSGLGFGLGGSGPGSMSRPRWLSNWTRYLI